MSRSAESKSSILGEQLEYYSHFAPDYDEAWLRQGRYDRGAALNNLWFRDTSVVANALVAFRPHGRILELACGTGFWSEKLLPLASRLTVVDGSSEMLALCAARLSSGEVCYVRADLFQWQPSEQFDMVFFSLWLSHVPPELFAPFWQMVGSCLAPGGRVFFVDSKHEATSTAIDHHFPELGTKVAKRRLNDGREFQIYKMFYDPEDLARRLCELGWDIEVRSTEHYFIYGSGGWKEG